MHRLAALVVSDSEVFLMHRTETRCQCLGAGESHDVCSSQCISSAGSGGT